MTEAQNLITGGVTDRQILVALKKLEPEMSEGKARRLLELAYAEFNRQAGRRKRASIGTALAERQRAKRLALTHTRPMVVDGEVEHVADPDHKGYLDACESEARLLGLNAPERKEVVVATFDVIFQELADAMRSEIRDPLPPARELLLKLTRRFKAVLEGGARAVAARSPQTIEAQVVVKNGEASTPPQDPTTNGVHFAPQSEQPPHTNGTS